MTINIKEECKEYEKSVPVELLLQILEHPMQFLAEDVRALIPNIELGADGPTLVSLFLVSDTYLCEVRISWPDQYFDYVALRSVANYRVRLSTAKIKGPDNTVVAEHQMATLKFAHHGAPPSFHTEISYVGNDRDAWLEKVRAFIPSSRVVV